MVTKYHLQRHTFLQAYRTKQDMVQKTLVPAVSIGCFYTLENALSKTKPKPDPYSWYKRLHYTLYAPQQCLDHPVYTHGCRCVLEIIPFRFLASSELDSLFEPVNKYINDNRSRLRARPGVLRSRPLERVCFRVEHPLVQA